MDAIPRQDQPESQFSDLAARLFREVPQEFFGVLASQNGPLYLDALDALERGISAGGSLTRTEAGDVVVEVLRKHRILPWEMNSPTRERKRQHFPARRI